MCLAYNYLNTLFNCVGPNELRFAVALHSGFGHCLGSTTSVHGVLGNHLHPHTVHFHNSTVSVMQMIMLHTINNVYNIHKGVWFREIFELPSSRPATTPEISLRTPSLVLSRSSVLGHAVGLVGSRA